MNNLNDIFFTPVVNQSITYDQILEDVQRYFSENHASTIAEAGGGSNGERAVGLLKELMVQYLVKRKYTIEGLTTEQLCEQLYEDMAGYSFLKKWIYKPGIEEVNINAYNDIEVIEAGGRSIKIPDKFSSPQHAIDVVRRMLNACGMIIDDTMPSVVGFLDKNIRISVDKTPIVDPEVGINASIRIVNQQTVSEQKLLDSGSATEEMLHFLKACIRYGVSVCIAGSTGSGKTTIMAWLLSNVPNNQRLITIEEGSRELNLVKRDENGNILNSVVHLLTRPSENPTLNINQDFLLERVLRKHPDVIGVGEMRSAAESLSAAESSRTGHTVCTTIHSNSCASTYRRMMTLAKRKYMMGDDVLMQIMVEAYPIIVFTKQLEDRSRKIMEIIEGEGYEGEELIYRTLYTYDVTDNTMDKDGNPLVVGRHRKVSEISNALKKRFLDNGISRKELDQFLWEKDCKKESKRFVPLMLMAFISMVVMLFCGMTAVPKDVLTLADGETGKEIIKVYELSPGEDPQALIEEPFEQNGYRYEYQSMVKEDLVTKESKVAEKDTTIETSTNDTEEILKQIPGKISYDGTDGYTGDLILDPSSIKTEVSGYATRSYTVSDTKIYPNLSYNDNGLIPQTTTKNGMTLKLASVSWQGQGGTGANGSLIPTSYTATAYYSAVGNSKYATGYTTTAHYSGDVTLETNLIKYTVTYAGTEIPPEPEVEIDNGPNMLSQILLGVGILTAGIICIITLIWYFKIHKKEKEEEAEAENNSQEE